MNWNLSTTLLLSVLPFASALAGCDCDLPNAPACLTRNCVCIRSGPPTYNSCNHPCNYCRETGGTVRCFDLCGCLGPNTFKACDPDECCFITRRVMETSDHSFKGDEAQYKELVDHCHNFEYKTSLYVDKHLYGLASPTEEAVAAGCPYVVIHNNDGEKQALAWMAKEDGEAQFPKESFPMGTFKLSTLAQAFEEADVDGDTPYDILTNNCAGFLVQVAAHLGLKVDMELTSFVTHRLLQEGGNKLLARFKKSANYFAFFDSRRLDEASMSKEELVGAVVQAHTEDLF